MIGVYVRWWLITVERTYLYLLPTMPSPCNTILKFSLFFQLTIDVTGREVLVITNTTLAQQTRNAARSTITVVRKQIIAAASDQLVSFFKGSFLLHVVNSFFLIDFVVTLFSTLETIRRLVPKYMQQLFLGSLLGTHR